MWILPPDRPRAEDGFERAGMQQGVNAKVCSAKIPCRRRSYGREAGGRQYTLKHSKVQVEAIAARIEPLELHRKVEKDMRFDLVVHDPDTRFNIIDQPRRDQALIEANDGSHRQTQTTVTLDQWLPRR